MPVPVNEKAALVPSGLFFRRLAILRGVHRSRPCAISLIRLSPLRPRVKAIWPGRATGRRRGRLCTGRRALRPPTSTGCLRPRPCYVWVTESQSRRGRSSTVTSGRPAVLSEVRGRDRRSGKRGRTGACAIGGGEDGEDAVADQLKHVAALPVDRGDDDVGIVVKQRNDLLGRGVGDACEAAQVAEPDDGVDAIGERGAVPGLRKNGLARQRATTSVCSPPEEGCRSETPSGKPVRPYSCTTGWDG